MNEYGFKYIAKALTSFIFTLAGTAFVASNGNFEAVTPGTWIEAFGAAIVAAGAVFAIPNAKKSPVGTVVNGLQDVQKQIDSLSQAAVNSVKRVQDSVAGLPGLPPVVSGAVNQVGSLTQQAINEFNRLIP